MGGGSPRDDQLLTGAYVVDGVTLEFMVDDYQDGEWEYPRFERTGNQGSLDPWGYTSAAGRDMPLPGYEAQQGQWFIRHNNNSRGFPPTTLRIRYTSTTGEPVVAASGEIWDIDRNYEQWRVTAFDAYGEILDETISPSGADEPLDGRPWTFGFSGLSDIREIQVEYIGSLATVGLAFNNFKPTTSDVPELDPIGDKTVYVGETLDFDVTATDPNDDPLFLGATGLNGTDLPVGANFDDFGDGTGTFEWTPTSNQVGPYVVKFTVIEDTALALDDYEIITITVTETPPPAQCDLDSDRDVDEVDRSIFLDTFGLCIEDSGYLPEANYDADQCITLSDYRDWYLCYTEHQ